TRLDVGGAIATSEWERSPSAIESFEWPFQLVDHGQIKGTLRTADGLPAAGLRVACWPADGQQQFNGSSGPVRGAAGAGGHFPLPSPVAENAWFTLRVVDDDFGVVTESGSEIRGCYRGVHHRNAQLDVTHDVQVQRGARRALLLVDGDGRPVPGCTV